MTEWNTSDKTVLDLYPKAIAHLRRRFQDKRLSLVFGSGLTQPLGLPSWNELNQLIAENTRVKGIHILAIPTEKSISVLCEMRAYKDIINLLGKVPEATIITQRLFEHFKTTLKKLLPPKEHHTLETNADIQRKWRKIIREELYGSLDNVKPDEIARKILDTHPYLADLLPIIKLMPLTITYNFDDVLELTLMGTRSESERKEGKGYEVTTDIRIPSRNQSRVVYHPNGYIPRNSMEEESDRIVLSEDEFAGRMIETMTGQYASLSHHFQRTTCVFIGLSLKDNILKNLLRQSAQVTPGHYHYFVHHYSNGKKPDEDEQKTIYASNFATYHLRTLFFSNVEISSLGNLISDGYGTKKGQAKASPPDSAFISLTKDIGVKPVYHYYIVGAVRAGKSMVVSHLRDLVTPEVWVDNRPLDLGEDWQELSKNEAAKRRRDEVDKWIAEQFELRNQILHQESVGIVVSDRCPLDPLAFTLRAEWSDKARYLRDKMGSLDIVEGQVIYLKNDPRVLALRTRRTTKKYFEPRLAEMQEALEEIYSMPEVIEIDTHLVSPVHVIQRVAHIIHLEPYTPSDLNGRLSEIINEDTQLPIFKGMASVPDETNQGFQE